MIILRILGLVFLFFTATALGFYAAAKNENELKTINRFITYITELRDRILYDGSEIYLLINKIFAKSGLVDIKDGRPILLDCGLKKTEKEILEDFFLKLGSTETGGEINRAELCLLSLKEVQKRLSNEINEKSKLYRILGICTGILGCILFI